MKIAQISPLWESVPPTAYGGIELIVGFLSDELVRRGHEVTLFASGDSMTQANLIPGCDRALRPQGLLPTQYMVYEQAQIQHVFSKASEFDVVHSHVDYPAFAYANFCKTPVVHTLHGMIPAMIEPIFRLHGHQNFVSLSESHRRPDLQLNYQATIYNAIAVDRFQFYPQPDEPHYLAFLGRMSEEKGPHLAIQIAKKAGLPLKMAGKVDFDNRHFFEQEILPQIDGEQIQFLGEADHALKNKLMGRALATLFPITWQEPFGLVMTESMASGTPVIAMEMGSTPEIIAHGQTGFLGQTVEECVSAVNQVTDLDRKACRDHVAVQFSVTRMVDQYESLYQKLVCQQPLYRDWPLAG